MDRLSGQFPRSHFFVLEMKDLWRLGKNQTQAVVFPSCDWHAELTLRSGPQDFGQQFQPTSMETQGE